jgi:hypothetical protein
MLALLDLLDSPPKQTEDAEFEAWRGVSDMIDEVEREAAFASWSLVDAEAL